MNMTFKGTYDNSRYAKYANEHVAFHRKHPIPDTIEYCGRVEFDSEGNPTFSMSIGDYILMAWEPQGFARFNRYGSYNGSRSDKPHEDNLRPENLRIAFFKHMVGESWAPVLVEECSEIDLDNPKPRFTVAIIENNSILSNKDLATMVCEAIEVNDMSYDLWAVAVDKYGMFDCSDMYRCYDPSKHKALVRVTPIIKPELGPADPTLSDAQQDAADRGLLVPGRDI